MVGGLDPSERFGLPVMSGEELPNVVMGAWFQLSGAHGQHRLGSAQHLNLALLIHTEHQRMVRRLPIESDDITHFFNQQRIARQLEVLAAVRLQPERSPDATEVGWPPACG